MDEHQTRGNRWRIVAMSGLLIAAVVGCESSVRNSSAKLAEQMAQFADLPQTRQSRHVGLEAELARVVDERGTPRLMMEFGAQGRNRKKMLRPRISDDDDAAKLLGALFEPAELKMAQHRLSHLFPEGDFVFEPEDLFKLRDALRFYSSHRYKFRQAMQRRFCNLRWPHVQGLMADTSTIDQIRAAAQLELLSVAEFLADDRPADALPVLKSVLRAAHFLSESPHLIPRLEAAQLRGEALTTMQAVASHAATTKSLLTQLAQVLRSHLESWTPDVEAWIGERADGLHTYEVVRQGHLLSILDAVELKRLQESKNYAAKVTSIRNAIDDDEVFYLSAMRQIIEACSLPFPERLPLFEELRTRMNDAARQSTYPYVAIEVLLKNFESGQRLQARDRSLCEGWALALALAADAELPPFKISPVTGRPYRLLKQPNRALVAGTLDGDDDYLLIVPIPE